jgi:glutaminyl-peptide cyclotransferase
MSRAAQWITAVLCSLVFATNTSIAENIQHQKPAKTPKSAEKTSSKPAFSGELALQHIAKQVSFGPRIIGHPAKQQTLDYIKQIMLPEADKFVVQPFQRFGLDGNNIWASFYPAASTEPVRNRIMLGAHWDTRPISDRDSNKEHFTVPVIGANDGASGVAVLLEIARLLSEKRAPVIVDLIFFDLEDMGEIDDLPFSIGASQFVVKNRFYRPQAGVIVDMVCDRDMVIPRESYSRDQAGNLQDKIWRIAAQQKATAFIDRDGTYINDDHLPFLKAGLEVVNLIHWPFAESWHTSSDSIDRCSTKSLQQVGNVLVELIYTIDESNGLN